MDRGAGTSESYSGAHLAEWDALQQEVEAFAHELENWPEGLTGTPEALDRLNDDLRTRFTSIRERISSLRATSAERDAMLRRSVDSSAHGEAALRRQAAREQRKAQLKHGARDVGEGLSRAWTELSAAVRKAASRMKTDKHSGGGTPPAQTPPGP